MSNIKYQIPKDHIIDCRCCQTENGEITHIITHKKYDQKKYFLFEVNDLHKCNQISQSITPFNLYEKIWKDDL